MLEEHLQTEMEQVKAKVQELKTQLDSLQPLIGMTSLKSPEATTNYKPFEQMMQPQNLTQVTKELNMRRQAAADPQAQDMLMAANDLDEIQLMENLLEGEKPK